MTIEEVRAGDTVAVIAPAGPLPADRFDAGLKVLGERYRVRRFLPAATSACAPYLATDDKLRVAAIVEALDDPEVKAIFCGRGGYGATRLLAELDRLQVARRFVARAMPLVGFSDITALHCWAFASARVSTFVHGPVVTQLPQLPADQLAALYSLLESNQATDVENLTCVASGRADGTLIGGNLTLLSHLCGTPYLPQSGSYLLLLEDVGEAPYRIDRMLTQLRQCAFFERVRGVVLGDFIDCSDDGVDVGAVLGERLGDLGLPVAAGAPIGHGKRNLAVPLGVPASLDAGAGTLRFFRFPSKHASESPAAGVRGA